MGRALTSLLKSSSSARGLASSPSSPLSSDCSASSSSTSSGFLSSCSSPDSLSDSDSLDERGSCWGFVFEALGAPGVAVCTTFG